MATKRMLCVWLPRYGLAVERRELASGGPGGLFQPDTRWRELVEVAPELEAAGARVGMPLKEAEAIGPGFALRQAQGRLFLPYQRERYARAFEAVLERLQAFSPLVEGGEPGTAWLDGDGLEPLYGPPLQLACRLRRAVEAVVGSQPAKPRAGQGLCNHAETTLFQVQVGVAGNKFTAHVAARLAGAEGVQVVQPGEEAAFLAPLPVATLPLPPEAEPHLLLLGVERVGQFAALPRNAVRHRFGPLGLRAHALANPPEAGDDEPLRPRPQRLVLRDSLELEWVEDRLDRLTFILKALADRLAARLAAHERASQALRVTWHLANGRTRVAKVRLAEPSQRGASLHEHLRWHLEGLRLEYGVTGLEVEAEELVARWGVQLKLFSGPEGQLLPPIERQRKAQHAVARLQARWGLETVRQASLTASRRPEAAFQWSPPDGLQPEAVVGPRPLSLEDGERSKSAPYWLLDPPQEVSVAHSPEADRLLQVRGQRVVAWGGPWRLVDAPWRPDGVARDYYQVATASGQAYWIYQDRVTDRWFLQGEFD